MDFKDESPLADSEKKDLNNIYTHSKKNADGTTQFYASKSKLYQNVDPKIQDKQSIQYEPFNSVYLLVKHIDGNWCLPYRTFGDRQPVDIHLNRFQTQLMGANLIIKPKENYPVASMIHQLEKNQLENNKLLSKVKGRKVLVFTAYHQTGDISLNNEPNYCDWAWVPKARLSEYLDEENYKKIIGLCTRY